MIQKQFLEYGWPINYVKDSLPNPPARSDALTYAKDIDNYISKEIENGHICGPFDSNPFRVKPSIAPLFTVPKKEGGRRVIVDCSYGGDNSVNDGIPIDTVQEQKHSYIILGMNNLLNFWLKQGRIVKFGNVTCQKLSVSSLSIPTTMHFSVSDGMKNFMQIND